jgi:CO/xanthine dehydrogenase Mo-binding subunit
MRRYTGQQLVHETLLVQMMEDIIRDTDYERKCRDWAGETGTWRHGAGLVTAYRGAALGGEGVDASGAMMIGMQDGSFVLRPTLMEFGQGLNTVYAQIAAEASGVALADIRVEPVDTTIMADSGLTVASRGTAQGGHAVRKAGEAIRAMIVESARMMLGARDDEQIEVRDSVAWVAGQPERSVRVSDIWTMRRYTGQQLSTYQ